MNKIFSKIVQAGAASVLLGGIVFAGGTAFAGQLPGQIEGGNSNYTISNVTKGTGFANTQTAGACDVLQYRLHLYNPGPSSISDVKVEATINTITPYTNYVSTATAYTPDGLTSQVSFESTLNPSTAETQSYVKDSTQLLNSAGNVISSSANGTLADTITDGGGGIDIGSLGESIDEYLQFQTKVNCPTPVPATCNMISTPAVDGNNIKINNVTYTANSAQVTGISLNFGNGVVNTYKTSDFPVTYTYPNSGNWTVTATVLTNLGNMTSTACTAAVTIAAATTTTPTTPATPAATQLVNTGPGSVLGIFGGTTIVGAVAYRLFQARRIANRSL